MGRTARTIHRAHGEIGSMYTMEDWVEHAEYWRERTLCMTVIPRDVMVYRKGAIQMLTSLKQNYIGTDDAPLEQNHIVTAVSTRATL